MDEKKYILTDEKIVLGCTSHPRTLYRVKSLRDFGTVRAGELGGYIEKESNLSHDGNCWVGFDAVVYEDAIVKNDAQVFECACVHGKSCIAGESIVRGESHIFGNHPFITGNVEILGHATIYGSSIIYGNAKVFDYSFIMDSIVCGNSRVYENAYVIDGSVIQGNAHIHGHVTVKDCVTIGGNSHILGRGEIGGYAYIRDAIVSDIDDYIVFKNWWSSGRYFTWTKSNNMWSVGCFYGTGEELIAKACKDSEISGREYERVVRYVESLTLPIKPAKRLNCIQRIVCKLFRIK